MKKMMFNDRFGLTNAVIQKRKTVTRRVINPQPDRARHWNPIHVKDELMYYQDERGLCQLLDEKGKVIYPPYKVGEIVAVAQSYNDIVVKNPHFQTIFVGNDILGNEPACRNKMYVKADLMPHQIRILDVRAERLQDITDEDCLREGIVYHTKINWSKPTEPFRCGKIKETTARKAFTSLIDKISDKGTWKSNPFVWRIEFEVLTEKQQTDGRTFRKNNTSQDQQ